MERETWDTLLSFLLAINDALLAPPAVKDDVGDQLCERVLGVLYEIWLISCVKSFPGPTLWKTFQEMCMNWRHRTGLITQWNRVNIALLARQLTFMYGGKMPQLNIPKEDAELVPDQMTKECIAQASYRFLNRWEGEMCCQHLITYHLPSSAWVTLWSCPSQTRSVRHSSSSSTPSCPTV